MHNNSFKSFNFSVLYSYLSCTTCL